MANKIMCLLASLILLLSACGGGSGGSNSDASDYLFLMNSSGATLTANDDLTYTLTLTGVDNEVPYFADEKTRIAGTADLQALVAGWWFGDEDEGENLPNAALQVTGGDASADNLVLSLTDPVYDTAAATLSFTAEVLDSSSTLPTGLSVSVDPVANFTAPLSELNLFVDDALQAVLPVHLQNLLESLLGQMTADDSELASLLVQVTTLQTKIGALTGFESDVRQLKAVLKKLDPSESSAADADTLTTLFSVLDELDAGVAALGVDSLQSVQLTQELGLIRAQLEGYTALKEGERNENVKDVRSSLEVIEKILSGIAELYEEQIKTVLDDVKDFAKENKKVLTVDDDLIDAIKKAMGEVKERVGE